MDPHRAIATATPGTLNPGGYQNYPEQALRASVTETPIGMRALGASTEVEKAASSLRDRLAALRDRLVGAQPSRGQAIGNGQVPTRAPVAGLLADIFVCAEGAGANIAISHDLVSDIERALG